jgi:hypothetical protein
MAKIEKESDRERDDRLKHLLFKGAPLPDGWKLPALIDPPPSSVPAAVARAGREIESLRNATFESWQRQPFDAGVMATPGIKDGWAKLTEWGKLDTMQHWINWEGVSAQDRAALMLAQLDPGKLSPELRAQITREAGKEPLPEKGATRARPDIDLEK